MVYLTSNLAPQLSEVFAPHFVHLPFDVTLTGEAAPNLRQGAFFGIPHPPPNISFPSLYQAAI